VVSRIRALFRHDPEAREPAALTAFLREARELTIEEAARRGVAVEAEVEAAAVDFLTKPFGEADLMAAITAALARDRKERAS
jgi:CheY-like chemotaxis protein